MTLSKEMPGGIEVAGQEKLSKLHLASSVRIGEGVRQALKNPGTMVTKLDKSIKYGKQHGGFGIEILYPGIILPHSNDRCKAMSWLVTQLPRPTECSHGRLETLEKKRRTN